MTDKRFHFGYVLGDTGLLDEEAEIKWFIENCCSVSDLKKNWVIVCEKLNEVHEEKEYWKERAKVRLNRTKEAHAYFDCLEKAIEQVCSDDIQEIIWNKYDELEKGLEE